MKFESFLLRDTAGNKSTTVTAFVIGFIVVNLKLLLSGMTIGGFTVTPFSGVEYAAAVGALGAVYVLRRNTDKDKKDESN